jgi:hypothetical protein
LGRVPHLRRSEQTWKNISVEGIQGIAPIYRDAFLAAGKKRSATTLLGLLLGASLVCTIKGVTDQDLKQITIQSDAILPAQTIQFNADWESQSSRFAIGLAVPIQVTAN